MCCNINHLVLATYTGCSRIKGKNLLSSNKNTNRRNFYCILWWKRTRKKLSNPIFFILYNHSYFWLQPSPVIDWEMWGTDHSLVCSVGSQIDLSAARCGHSRGLFAPLDRLTLPRRAMVAATGFCTLTWFHVCSILDLEEHSFFHK